MDDEGQQFQLQRYLQPGERFCGWARGGSLQSVFVNQLPNINQSVRADASGSLEFGSSPGWNGRGYWANTGTDFFSPGTGVPAFYDIPDVARVYGLVNQARSASG